MKLPDCILLAVVVVFATTISADDYFYDDVEEFIDAYNSTLTPDNSTTTTLNSTTTELTTTSVSPTSTTTPIDLTTSSSDSTTESSSSTSTITETTVTTDSGTTTTQEITTSSPETSTTTITSTTMPTTTTPAPCTPFLNGNQMIPCSLIDGKCHCIFQYLKTWSEAKDECSKNNMELVSIETSTEQTALVSFIKQQSVRYDYFTSGKKNTNGQWQWTSTGQNVIYAAWATGEPNGSGDCMYMNDDYDFAWGDGNCDSLRYFICELLSAPSTATTTAASPTTTSISQQCDSYLGGDTKIPCFAANGRCYCFGQTLQTWDGAYALCAFHSKSLVGIVSSDVQNAIVSIINSQSSVAAYDYYTSGKKTIAGWMWTAQDTLISNGYTNWFTGEPNGSGDCLYINDDYNFKWGDASCTGSRLFICE